MQRYVTDWAGPELPGEGARVRLGAPDYPATRWSSPASVSAVDAATGRVDVAMPGPQPLGAHVTGTVDLELPAGPTTGRA